MSIPTGKSVRFYTLNRNQTQGNAIISRRNSREEKIYRRNKIILENHQHTGRKGMFEARGGYGVWCSASFPIHIIHNFSIALPFDQSPSKIEHEIYERSKALASVILVKCSLFCRVGRISIYY